MLQLFGVKRILFAWLFWGLASCFLTCPILAAPSPIATKARNSGPASANPTKLILSSNPLHLTAGQTAIWTLQIVDVANNKPVQQFVPVHEKLMHLIVVSQDLRWFNHLHPDYQGNGTFTLNVQLPRDGIYYLFADYTPQGRRQQVMRQQVEVGANVATGKANLAIDKAQDGWLVQQVAAAPEGQWVVGQGAGYFVQLKADSSLLRAGQGVLLRLQIFDADYQPVNDVQPYLGTQGHLVILSVDAQTFLHTHPLAGAGGEQETFNASVEKTKQNVPDDENHLLFHTIFPRAGLYKIWAQFKHRDLLITAPFVIKVEAESKEKSLLPPAKLAATTLDAALAFTDLQGKRHHLKEWRGKVPVFIFVDTLCPCVTSYKERVRELAAKYAVQGLRVIYVFSQPNESLAQIRSYAATQKYPWLLAHDPNQALLRAFGARCTTEAFLLDRTGALRYRGRIDDNIYSPDEVSRRDLEEAVRAVLEHRPVKYSQTQAIACAITRLKPSQKKQ